MKWVILADSSGTPRFPLNADGCLRSALLGTEPLYHHLYFHGPIIATDTHARYRLEAVFRSRGSYLPGKREGGQPKRDADRDGLELDETLVGTVDGTVQIPNPFRHSLF